MIVFDPRAMAIGGYRGRAAELAEMAAICRDDGSPQMAALLEAAAARLRACARSEAEDPQPAGLAPADRGTR